MERLDKVLANLGYGSRKEVKSIIKDGRIKINGNIADNSSAKIDTDRDKIEFDDNLVDYRKHIYIVMNKPAGVVSATHDNYDETVIDILDPKYAVFDPFPVGRLDKDTVGLLIITNDGEMNHRMISPKWNMDKVYYAEIDKRLNDDDVKLFHDGVVLDDGYKCLPAKLDILKSDKDGAMAEVTVHEGKFHQVKRMFESIKKNVVYLKRIKFGPIELDDSMREGDYRELSEIELKNVMNMVNMQ